MIHKRIIIYKNSSVNTSVLLDYLKKLSSKEFVYAVVFVDKTFASYIKGIYDHDVLMQIIDDKEWCDDIFIIAYSDVQNSFPANKKMIYPIDTIGYDGEQEFKQEPIESPIFIIGNPVYFGKGPKVVSLVEDDNIVNELLTMPLSKVEYFFVNPKTFIHSNTNSIGDESLVIGVNSKDFSIVIHNEDSFATINSGLKIYWTKIENISKSNSIKNNNTPEDINITLGNEVVISNTTFIQPSDYYDSSLESGMLIQAYFYDQNDLDYTENYIFQSLSSNGKEILIKPALTVNGVHVKIDTDVFTHSNIFSVTLSEN